MRSAPVLVALAPLFAWGCCCGLGPSDDDLESAERVVPIEGSSVSVTAELTGQYVLEHHGGGRFGWNETTDEERWLLRVHASGDGVVDLVPRDPWSRGWTAWSGADRAVGVERMEALAVEACAVEGGAVFRVIGGGDPSLWMIARPAPGGASRGAFVARLTRGETCAEAAAGAPSVADHLTLVWEDGLRAASEHRELGGAAAITSERGGREAAGVRACDVLLDRGEGEEALRCLWASRIEANPSRSEPRRAMALVADGADAEIDLEAAMLALLSHELPPPSDAALVDQHDRHLAYAVPTWLETAHTPERLRAFLGDALGVAGPGWRIVGVGSLAARLEDEVVCTQVIDAYLRWLEDPGNASAVLGGARRIAGCGTDDRFAALMRAGLGRRTLPEGTEAGDTCGVGAILRGTYRTTVCASFPRFAGSWLADHCDEAANDRAWTLARERLDAEAHVHDDAILDGSLRVLARCDADALDAELLRREREDVRRFIAAWTPARPVDEPAER